MMEKKIRKIFYLGYVLLIITTPILLAIDFNKFIYIVSSVWVINILLYFKFQQNDSGTD